MTKLWQFSHRPLSRQAKQARSLGLSLVSSPVLGAFFFRGPQHPSPLFCPLRAVTGIPCPGCGLTRSFLAIARGHLREAVSQHAFGPILFISFCLIALHLAVELCTRRRLHLTPVRWFLRSRKVQFFALVSLLGYYFIRLYFLLHSGELGADFSQSPFGQFLFSR